MLTEPLPVAIFVKLRYQDPLVNVIIEKWRVEREDVEEVLINHFKEIGIYSIDPLLEKSCFNKMLEWLEHSPTIWAMVKKGDDDELRRRASRRDHG